MVFVSKGSTKMSLHRYDDIRTIQLDSLTDMSLSSIMRTDDVLGKETEANDHSIKIIDGRLL
ncbi:hypothetical protein HMPREF9555_00204 [Selenomonas artemidis F0399]|uniref:Uncharacterized protein n=1 Tax=Selenomonas artemidis F0399 TaxID=749551 RepID=E7MZR2_9FIRM|nr:hypothetical protein HMPREF9555_00204 [Selenomonas artemidis F0399]